MPAVADVRPRSSSLSSLHHLLLVGRIDLARRGRDLRWLAVLTETTADRARPLRGAPLSLHANLNTGRITRGAPLSLHANLNTGRITRGAPLSLLARRGNGCRIRSPRGDGVGPELTFFPSMPTAAPAAVIARRRARHPCSRCVDGVIAAVWQGCREDSQHAIAAKTQETV